MIIHTLKLLPVKAYHTPKVLYYFEEAARDAANLLYQKDTTVYATVTGTVTTEDEHEKDRT